MVESVRLLEAYQRACRDLLGQREPAGHWVGELSTSALATATAISALSLVARSPRAADSRRDLIQRLIAGGIVWLTEHQNADGGWGDTPTSYSNIATTMLVIAAFRLAGAAPGHAGLLERADRYVDQQGRIAGLRRRYGPDKTFAVPILANCALAGLVSWRDVAALPFELACVPQKFYRFAQLPVVSYAIPALVAIGQVRHAHHKPWNPLLRAVRDWAMAPSLRVLQRMLPDSGGYLEAVPLTSFVVMSLADLGHRDHAVTLRGTEFLISSVRPDGSWPIDTNLATWNTTLAINALASGDAGSGDLAHDNTAIGDPESAQFECLPWLLSCQHRQRHPFTGADPGGWGWSDLSGAVPDADDTPGALLALDHGRRSASCGAEDRRRIRSAAESGCRWLLDLQNRDGGWPTFCRGWGKLPFDRSGADLTAHALRALGAWRDLLSEESVGLGRHWQQATRRGFRYLDRIQRADGSWIPLWFGNQDYPDEENPVYGTAKVLLAYHDWGLGGTLSARGGSHWLAINQNDDGGWGGGPDRSSVEETALATEALLRGYGGLPAGETLAECETLVGDGGLVGDQSPFVGEEARQADECRRAAWRGVQWLVEAVERGRHGETWPIGFYFAKLWYYEKLYPLTFTVSALAQAVRTTVPPTASRPTATSLPRT